MPRLRRLLLITFLESFACILVERGIYFYCSYRLDCDKVANLWLAFAFGVAYVVGAVFSHAMCARFSEKLILALAVFGQAALHVTLAVSPTLWVVFIGTTLIGLLNGGKWPIIESYISAGQAPATAARSVGMFNVSWAVAVPPAIAIVGPLMEWLPGFAPAVLAAAMNLAVLGLLLPLTRRPVHLPNDHPTRPARDVMARLRAMLGFARWTMFFSYAGLFAMAALMPDIFKGFGCSESQATALSCVIDIMRLAAFAALIGSVRWHHRWSPLAVSMAVIPAGFVLVLAGPSLAWVLLGEVAFGLAAGTIYYAALYYAMVVQNASVDAGGAHEGLIGLGFAVGPLACLGGMVLAPHVGGQTPALLLGAGPLFLLCAAGALASSQRKAPQMEPA